MTVEELVRPIDPKEEKILQAAGDAFLELGYAATSMDLVASRAHASKTTLYTRFPSKEVLFAAVVAAKCEESGMRFGPDEFAGVSLDEALCAIGNRFLGLICSPEALRVEQVVMSEAPRFPEIAIAFEREGPEKLIQAMTEFFAAAASQGSVKISDPKFTAEYFLNALKGPCVHNIMLRQHSPLSPEEQADFVNKTVALFLDGIRNSA